MRLEQLFASLNRNWRESLKIFVKKLRERYGRITVVLFGSRARGDYSASSDTDLLVILEKYSWDDIRFMLDLAYKCRVVSPELHVFTLRDALEQLETNTVLLDAIYEGIVLVDEFQVIDKLRKRLRAVLQRLKKTKHGWICRDN